MERFFFGFGFFAGFFRTGFLPVFLAAMGFSFLVRLYGGLSRITTSARSLTAK
jgi:hypothetical protein